MIGTVISTFESPSPDAFSFVLKEKKGIPVRKDQFVSVKTEEGLMVARVVNIRKTNRYFMSAEAVKDYSSQTSMDTIFPVDEWEFLVADALPLGILADQIRRTTFPPSPGSEVELIEGKTLSRFLGFVQDKGIVLGDVEHHDVPAAFDLTRLLQKHVAILAMSGAGKSNLTSVMLEELIQREKGRLGIVVIDPHGEYVGLSQLGAKIIEGHKVSIPVKDLSADQIASLIPISAAQRRDLNRIIKDLREQHQNYDLETIIARIDADEDMKENSKTALTGWLSDLNNTHFFNGFAYPDPAKMAPGETWVLDMSKVSGLKNQQTIVAYLSRKLFSLRKQNKVSPYLMIIEEAHNFVPEGTKWEYALSKGILETMAREGRKFHASLCLISQRPIRLSSTILSQCNTHIILRVTNPYDLKHIGESSEGITNETQRSITSLQVGQALVVGEAVNYPVFIKVRLRKIKSPHEKTLEEAAIEFEQNQKQENEDSKAFMGEDNPV